MQSNSGAQCRPIVLGLQSCVACPRKDRTELLPRLIARVEALDLFAELGAVNVGVDLRRSYVFVAEEELDGLEVRTAFEEGGGEAVTEGVGANCLLYTRHLSSFAHHHEDGDA